MMKTGAALRVLARWFPIVTFAFYLAEPAFSAVPTHPPREVYYGDLHLHTSYSFDAYLQGTTSVGPDEAYRFAKGEVVEYLGQPLKRREPLDFMAVTDHAENLGVLNMIGDPDGPFTQSEVAKSYRALQTEPVKGSNAERILSFIDRYFSGSKNKLPDSFAPVVRAAWTREIELANRHYEPGVFTTFIGYEWTAFQNGGNIHRNVIFRGDAAPAPFTSFDSKSPEDLWAWLDGIRKDGFEALAIPHNANGSAGLMYDWIGSFLYMTKAYAEQRQRNEPLGEISQMKGTSETHPLLSPEDEFANYEIVDFWEGIRRRRGRVEGSYLRDGLSRGLVLQRQLGSNPYKYGFVGGSDLHGGLSVSSQAEFGGYAQGVEINLGPGRPPSDAANGVVEHVASGVQRLTSGSLTGVWAESNTRDSIYNALRRRETFATTGTKLKLRFFGGWDLGTGLLEKKDWVATAYARGVPMGSDLPVKPGRSKAPIFVAWAVKDPNSGSLDRLQVIKVWESNGKQREKIFDIAWAGNRKQDGTTGKLPAIGDAVDRKTGRLNTDIGVSRLEAVWEDPEFDSRSLAAYYLRVLEVPAPRWSTLMAIQTGTPLPEDIPAAIQPRAWSSPIWYTVSQTDVATDTPRK
jgi:hypothetical protein